MNENGTTPDDPTSGITRRGGTMSDSVDRGLTGRDVITKTFSTRTRRGYDPIEVDAFLEQLATQIDSLHAEIDRFETVTETPPPPPPPSATDAPPVGVVSPMADTDSEATALVLSMAQKASAEAIDGARQRADEIVAEAEFQASEMQREADRKSFETSARTQGELRSIEVEVESRRGELDQVRGTVVGQRDRLRQIGVDVGLLADGIEIDGEDVVDLRAEASAAPLSGEDAADLSS